MEAENNQSAPATPEQFIQSLVAKLRHQALWDSLLTFLPPLAAVFYCLFYLFREAWLSPTTAAALAIAGLTLSVLAIVIRYRPKVPSVLSAASLIDDRGGTQDRFLTIATLQPSTGSASLVSRLRGEASRLQSRIAIKREFPYQIRRHVYASLLISLAAAFIFPLLLPLAHSTLYPRPSHEQLRELARRMTERPNLQTAALSLQNLADKLDNPDVPPQEQQRLVQEQRKKMAEQERKEQQPEDRQLLGQASSMLKGLEEQSGGGEEKKKDQKGGGIQSNLPQEGQGEGQQKSGAGGDSQGERSAQLNNEMKQGKMTQENPKGQDKEKNAGGVGDQPDPNKPGKDKGNERPGKTDGGRDEKPGRSKVSEEIPQGLPPAERFYKDGEGRDQGIKGAGYVTVQLPEEIAQDGKGGGQKRDSKGGKAPSSQIPVSNVPLPKHVPDAPAEKQQMPLEYRGIIR